MSENKSQCFGSLIGLKEEFRDQYIVLHANVFPSVLDRIHKSNISDYSIFLVDNLLFSFMEYTGSDYDSDMKAIGADSNTQEWWKLTDPMQKPFDQREAGEWWMNLIEIYSFQNPKLKNSAAERYAFKIGTADNIVPAIEEFVNSVSGLERIKLFSNGAYSLLYFEHSSTIERSLVTGKLNEILKDKTEFQEMTEVFHTEKKKVFVTGCFDLLHSGHIAFLQEAASFGDLYVCIGSDENVNNLKGRYPENTQDERKYMIDALKCVAECKINTGWGYIDFVEEIKEIRPDVFVVNEDGHTPAKQALCDEMGIEYHVLKRVPHADLPKRSTTAIRTECTIPFRIDLAGGWLDQPYVSKYYPGPVLTISIEPGIAFNDRSGMSTSTRRKAIELWSYKIPPGDPEKLARILFSYENPPGTKDVSGSQDSLGIVLPGLNKLDYDGHYWPHHIDSNNDEDLLSWIEERLYLITLQPREASYYPLDNTNISEEGAKALSDAANDCWNAIIEKDSKRFGDAFRRSFEAQVAMFPNMADEELMQTIDQYKDKALGWKLSGAGGGGYLILVSDEPVEGAMQIEIRRNGKL